jgi:DeoR family transcriptional regulator of aga operon
MLSIAERHKYILDKLNKYGFVRITDVANELGVTKVTIRKDVKILESKGLLYKVHGSARPANPHVADLDVHVKDNINRDAKRLIAQRAQDGMWFYEGYELPRSIPVCQIVASGSTIYSFAEEIKMRQWHHLNIVTPFLRLGVLLNEAENVNVVQLGGTVHKKSLSVLGEEASRSLDDCICSKLFFGVDGIDLEHGITTSTLDEAKLTRKMMKASSQNIVLADSSKFGQRGFGRICALEDIDVIITDDGIPEQMVTIVEEAGVDLIIVR